MKYKFVFSNLADNYEKNACELFASNNFSGFGLMLKDDYAKFLLGLKDLRVIPTTKVSEFEFTTSYVAVCRAKFYNFTGETIAKMFPTTPFSTNNDVVVNEYSEYNPLAFTKLVLEREDIFPSHDNRLYDASNCLHNISDTLISKGYKPYIDFVFGIPYILNRQYLSVNVDYLVRLNSNDVLSYFRKYLLGTIQEDV